MTAEDHYHKPFITNALCQSAVSSSGTGFRGIRAAPLCAGTTG